jgi:hypothetical protein
MDTGTIVTNISSTIGFGFVSAFVDEHPPTAAAAAGDGAGNDEPVLWLFGSACNRCPHTPSGPQGCIPNRKVQSWRAVNSSDPSLQRWEAAVVGGTYETYNVEVDRVTSTPAQQAAAGLPPHRYVMIMEIGHHLFVINNAPDGDLSKGWVEIPNVNNDLGISGGPSIRYNNYDQMYYILEGGHVTM